MRINFFITILLTCCFCETRALNLVPNNGFESYSQLPDYYGQMNYCEGWTNVNGVYTFSWPWASPDYLHNDGCCGVQLPNTAFGIVHPFAGDAVAHLILYYSPFSEDFREYISTQLSQPMLAGTTYKVSFYAQSGENYEYIQGSNHLGVCFSSGSLTQVDHEPIAVNPQLEYPGVFYDTSWHLISFTFTPTADYDWMTIGNFYNDANTTVQVFHPTGLLGVHLFVDEVIVEPITIPLIASDDTIICEGNSVTLTASGNGGYWWEDLSNPGISIDDDSILIVTPVSTSTFIVHDNFSSDTIEVTVVNSLSVNLGNDTTICEGQSLLLDAANTNATYLWSTGNTSQTINVGAAGSYWVNVESGSCVASDTIIVYVLPLPSVDLGPDLTGCSGQSFTLIASNADSYLWSTGSTDSIIEISVAGNYSVTVSDGFCFNADTVQFITIDSPTVELGSDILICEGETVTLVASGNADSYSWSTGETSSSIVVNAEEIYLVTVSNGYCSNRDSVFVKLISRPVIDLGNDTSLCTGQLILDAGNTGAIFEWSTGEASQQIIVTETPIEVFVEVTKNGCKSSDTISVINNCGVVVPNAFTPNGDGLNDIFIPIATNGVSQYEMRIFNRYGETIFITTDPNTGWDGSYKGKGEEIGSYVYLVQSKTLSGDSEIYKGNVTLLR